MTLNSDQSALVHQYIEKSGIKFVDIGDEIIDHICTQIESDIDGGCSFDDAFDRSKRKWKLWLKKDSSAWIGWIYSLPRIALNRAVKRQKAIYLEIIMLSLAAYCGLFLIKKVDIIDASTLYRACCTIFIMLICINFWLSARLWLSGFKSTYRFLFFQSGYLWLSLFYFYIFFLIEYPQNSSIEILILGACISNLVYIKEGLKHFSLQRPLQRNNG